MSCNSTNKSEDAVSLLASETDSLTEIDGNKNCDHRRDKYDSEDRRYDSRTENRRIISRTNNYYRWDDRRTPPSRSTYYRRSNYSLRNNQPRREEDMRLNKSRYEPTRNVSRNTMPSRRWQSNEGSWTTSKNIQESNMKINISATRSRKIETQSGDRTFPSTNNIQKGNSGKQVTMPTKRARTPTSEEAALTTNKKQKEDGTIQETKPQKVRTQSGVKILHTTEEKRKENSKVQMQETEISEGVENESSTKLKKHTLSEMEVAKERSNNLEDVGSFVKNSKESHLAYDQKNVKKMVKQKEVIKEKDATKVMVIEDEKNLSNVTHEEEETLQENELVELLQEVLIKKAVQSFNDSSVKGAMEFLGTEVERLKAELRKKSEVINDLRQDGINLRKEGTELCDKILNANNTIEILQERLNKQKRKKENVQEKLRTKKLRITNLLKELKELKQANKEHEEKHSKEIVKWKQQVKELKLKNIEDEKMSCLTIQDGLERFCKAKTNTHHLFSIQCGDIDINVVKRTASEDKPNIKMKYRDTGKEEIETDSKKLNKKQKSSLKNEKEKVANDGGLLSKIWKSGDERDKTAEIMEQSRGISNCLQAGTALKSVSREAKTFPEMEETFKNEDHLSLGYLV